jgi:hypothetical protein
MTDNPIAYMLSYNTEATPNEKWDFGFLKEAFNKKNIEILNVKQLPNCDRAFVVIPGPQSIGNEDGISNELNKIKRVVLFITGDEEGTFDIEKITHNNIEIWIQYPHEKHQAYNKLPTGTPQHLKENLPNLPIKKDYDVYFAGQITHQRRQELDRAMSTVSNALYLPTKGFTQGDPPKEYYTKLASAKFAPAPSGVVVVDSFRFYEAIEMLCLPIADSINANGQKDNFWERLFDHKYQGPQINNWKNLESIKEEILSDYPQNMHKVVQWWIHYKRDFANKIMEQVNEY